MNCVTHPDQTAVAFCRACGKALCGTCQRRALGTVYCDQHVPEPASATYTASAAPPPPGASPWNSGPNPYLNQLGASPGLAFVLGMIPGVGAIYNGQYAKGLIHAVIFGLFISILSSDAAPGLEPLVGILLSLWFFYMAFEAYHTALKRQRGQAVDEFSSILPMPARGIGRNFPVGPVLMIGLGVVFLLNTLDVVRLYDILRLWPVFLIALGGYLLYLRLTERPADAVRTPDVSEVGHE